MPRPPKPLLDHRLIIATALDLIDDEGLPSFSTVRLGRRLGVSAPSLYHHVDDRAAILAGVAELVVRETRLPPYRRGDDWVRWLVDACTSLRRAILRHPHTAPVLLEHLPRDLLAGYYNLAAEILASAGVPVGVHCLLLDGLETYTISSALICATAGSSEPPFGRAAGSANRYLARATAADPAPDPEFRFRAAIQAMVVGSKEPRAAS